MSVVVMLRGRIVSVSNFGLLLVCGLNAVGSAVGLSTYLLGILTLESVLRGACSFVMGERRGFCCSSEK